MLYLGQKIIESHIYFCTFSSFAISCFPLVSADFTPGPLGDALHGGVSNPLELTPGASSNIH